MNISDSDRTAFQTIVARNTTIEIDPDEKGLSQAQAFIGDMLDRRYVNASIAAETMSLFEAVFHAVVFEIGNCDAKIEVSNIIKPERTDIKIQFPGKRFSLPEGGCV